MGYASDIFKGPYPTHRPIYSPRMLVHRQAYPAAPLCGLPAKHTPLCPSVSYPSVRPAC